MFGGNYFGQAYLGQASAITPTLTRLISVSTRFLTGIRKTRSINLLNRTTQSADIASGFDRTTRMLE